MSKILTAFFLAVLSLNLCAQADKANQINFLRLPPGIPQDSIIRLASGIKPSARQVAWQEREVTVFIHFGINTFTGREWGNKSYVPEMFNPTELDARQWAAAAKTAGAKLLIMVAKHHDGFCLWPSEYTDFSVKNSPWKNGNGDVISEVASACREYGLKLGIYLSPWDIHSPVYGTDAYNEYFKNQLRELLTNYGEISEVWFDGACGEGPNGKKQVYEWMGFYQVVRELQPGAVIAVTGPDVRWVGTESGFGRDTEWSVVPLDEAALAELEQSSLELQAMAAFHPAMDMQQADLGSNDRLKNATALAWYPSEVDVSIRPGWFYHPEQDSLVKSPEQLVDIYFSSVGRNSVLLLNLPPDQRGLIHENDVASLKAFREIIEKIFQDNLLKDARITSNPAGSANDLKNLTDDDPLTYFRPSGNRRSFDAEFKLASPATFDVMMMHENFRNGQRVENFVFEAFVDGNWKNLCTGTTIGYKRILRFEKVTSNHVRLRVLSSRATPEISSIGLFLTESEIKN
jgi:alpha-L-fucosidase